MNCKTNEFLPKPPAEGETYGDYLGRMEDAMVVITTLEKPSEDAIQALAFIAMEAPADFDHCSSYFEPPGLRMWKFLARLPEELRVLFRAEAMKLPRGREDRVENLLRVSSVKQ